MRVWVAGRIADDHMGWQLLGIYQHEITAIDRCCTGNDFVGEVQMDEDLPEETTAWPGAYYPLAPAVLDIPPIPALD